MTCFKVLRAKEKKLIAEINSCRQEVQGCSDEDCDTCFGIDEEIELLSEELEDIQCKLQQMGLTVDSSLLHTSAYQ